VGVIVVVVVVIVTGGKQSQLLAFALGLGWSLTKINIKGKMQFIGCNPKFVVFLNFVVKPIFISSS